MESSEDRSQARTSSVKASKNITWTAGKQTHTVWSLFVPKNMVFAKQFDEYTAAISLSFPIIWCTGSSGGWRFHKKTSRFHLRGSARRGPDPTLVQVSRNRRNKVSGNRKTTKSFQYGKCQKQENNKIPWTLSVFKGFCLFLLSVLGAPNDLWWKISLAVVFKGFCWMTNELLESTKWPSDPKCLETGETTKSLDTEEMRKPFWDKKMLHTLGTEWPFRCLDSKPPRS